MENPQVYQFGSDNNGWNNAWPLYAMNGGNGFRYDRREEDWNERDDEMMRRRMRDSRGRYTRR